MEPINSEAYFRKVDIYMKKKHLFKLNGAGWRLGFQQFQVTVQGTGSKALRNFFA